MKFDLSSKSECKKFSDNLKDRVQNAQKNFINNLVTALRFATPKKTGAAAASWNISKDHPIYVYKNVDLAIQIDSVSLGETVYITNGAPYIWRLNNGWSKQAPKRFIQITINSALSNLAQYIKE